MKRPASAVSFAASFVATFCVFVCVSCDGSGEGEGVGEGDPQLDERFVDVVEGGSVTLDDDVALDDLTTNGALVVADVAGRVVVTAPFGAGDTTLKFDQGADVVQYAVHVVPLAWSRVAFSDGPEAREHGALMTSSDADVVYART